MKYFIAASISLILAGCASNPDRMPLPAPEGVPHENPIAKQRTQRNPVSEAKPRAMDLSSLQNQLGLARTSNDLGYSEKSFDGCQMGVRGEDGKCGNRYLTVVNFRLVCRDTEDTTENVVSSLTPVVTNDVKWKVKALNGVTHTDSSGYGQVLFLSQKPQAKERLVLTVGRQFLGLEISQVRQIVVPVYWCTQLAQTDSDLRPVRFISDFNLDP